MTALPAWLGLEGVCLAHLGGMCKLFASAEAVVSGGVVVWPGLGRASGPPSLTSGATLPTGPPSLWFQL